MARRRSREKGEGLDTLRPSAREQDKSICVVQRCISPTTELVWMCKRVLVEGLVQEFCGEHVYR